MHDHLFQNVKKYHITHRRKKLWQRVVRVFGCIVVFCTVYALILPAITMESETVCGLEAHTHNESCYAAAPVSARFSLICDEDQLSLHVHSADCYDDAGVLRCGLADFVLHTHDRSCYDDGGRLVCSLPEIEAHIHTDSCYAQSHAHSEGCYTPQKGELLCMIAEGEPHVHTDSCFSSARSLACTLPETPGHGHTAACYTETRTLICSLDERTGHLHDETCYDEAGTVICGLEETEGHAHDGACYAVSSVLSCGQEETDGHMHDEACYQDAPVQICDLEEGASHIHNDACYAWTPVLTCEIPLPEEGAVPTLICEKQELLPHIHEDACRDANGILICGLLQVEEHVHDSQCFMVDQVQSDEPVLVCGKEQHEHTAECYPPDDPGAEDGTLSDPAGASQANCGRIEHTHLETCYSESGTLMCTITEHTHTAACFAAPDDPASYRCGLAEHIHEWECFDQEGDLICALTEHMHDDHCLLTVPPAEAEILTELSYTGADYMVSVSYGPDAGLPEGVMLTVEEILPGTDDYDAYYDQSVEVLDLSGWEQQKALVFARFFDVQFQLDGRVCEPEGPVSVTITYDEGVETDRTADCQAIHFGEEGPELLDVDTEETWDGATSFTHTQDSFSVVGTLVTRAVSTAAAGAHHVTFMVICGDGTYKEVGSLPYYDTGTVKDTERAYITSKVAERFFGGYGYTAGTNLGGRFSYSYDDIYQIKFYTNNAETTSCWDIPDSNYKENEKVEIWTANDGKNQRFRIWDAEDGYKYITPLADSSLYVSVTSGATSDGTKLALLGQENASQWAVSTTGDATKFCLKGTKNSYIDLDRGDTTNGIQLQIWSDGTNTNWKLEQRYSIETAVVEENGDGTYNIGLTLESNGDIVCFYEPTGTVISTADDLAKLGTSGEYYLANDITINALPEGKGCIADIGDKVSSTLYLNGHTITYNPDAGKNGSSCIWLHGTGSLTIKDTGQPIETTEVVSGDHYGNLATYNSSSKTLIYYVTESEPDGDGTTTEKLVKHTVDLSNVGAIESNPMLPAPHQFIYLSDDAVLNIKGGRYTNANGARAITASGYDDNNGYTKCSAEVNISGGYLCGNTTYGSGIVDGIVDGIVGGAVYVNSTGALNISGGVIAANRADKAGGVYKNGGSFSMTGGVISGNQVSADEKHGTDDTDCRGGGVQVDNAVTVISGGYITNNRLDYKCGAVGSGCHFGGGITQYSGTMTIEQGCYVTGNYSAEAGGGIGFSGQQFIMTGGTVAANVAESAEGGGIRIQSSDRTSLITGGYVTNNRTNSMHDWGGGGIFLVQGQSLQIMNAVFMENTADGFGGGVGGCSTGQIVAVDNTVGGVAIFDNKAYGRTMSGSDGVANSKQDDLTAQANEVFMTNGYDDFFCALNSAVAGSMLGDGAENWHGSRDYAAIDIGKDQVVTANKMMGLNASPADGDKQTAIKQGTVFVSGNFSQTHGGGIMSNGILILGQAKDIALSPGLEIEVYKAFKDANGSDLDQQPGQFQFLLQDENHGTIATVSNNAYGMILVERDYAQAGTYTYYLKEQSGSNPLITYDSTEYQITVTVGTDIKKLNLSENQSLTITYYVVTKIDVTLSSGTETVSTQTGSVGSTNHRATVLIKKDNGEAFTNTMNQKPFYFRIKKLDGSNSDKPMQFVEFTLKDPDGNQITSGKTDKNGYVSLPVEKGKTYQLFETKPEGYQAAGPWILKIDGDGNGTLWEATADSSGDLNKNESGVDRSEVDGAVYLDYIVRNYLAMYELPQTGGMGTTLFYVLGGVLVVGAVVLLITKKRMGAEQ